MVIDHGLSLEEMNVNFDTVEVNLQDALAKGRSIDEA